jgi:LysM repeat protein
VRQGDTLTAIAQRFMPTVNVNEAVEELARINHIEDPNTIFSGQILIMPVTPSV